MGAEEVYVHIIIMKTLTLYNPSMFASSNTNITKILTATIAHVVTVPSIDNSFCCALHWWRKL